MNLCTFTGKSTDSASITSVCIVGESIPSAAAGAGRNGVFNVGTPLKVDPHFFRQFDQKEQQPPSMDAASCKNTNTNCSRTNAAHESLLTMTSRAGSTQHSTDSVDSHSIMTSSLHDAIVSSSLGSASSLPTETPITGSDRMMLPREDVLLSSSFSKRTCTLEKMKSAFVDFFYSYFIL